MITTVVSLIISMGFLTFGLSLHVHSRKWNFYENLDLYTRMAISDGLTWPYTFVRVLRDFAHLVK